MERSLSLLAVILVVGCEGDLGAAVDASVTPGVDGGPSPAIDAFVSGADAWSPPAIDAGPPDPGTCSMGPALSEPIAGCAPAVLPSTKARVMRARPFFPTWGAIVTVHYHSLSEDQIVQFAQRAGAVIGVCDWRPRNGRFDAELI